MKIKSDIEMAILSIFIIIISIIAFLFVITITYYAVKLIYNFLELLP